MQEIKIHLSDKPVLKMISTFDEVLGYGDYLILPEDEEKIIKHYEKIIPDVLSDEISIFIQNIYEIDSKIFSNFGIFDPLFIKGFEISPEYINKLKTKNLFIDKTNKKKHIFKPVIDLTPVFKKGKKLKPILKIKDFCDYSNDAYIYIYNINGKKIITYNELSLYELSKEQYKEIVSKLNNKTK